MGSRSKINQKLQSGDRRKKTKLFRVSASASRQISGGNSGKWKKMCYCYDQIPRQYRHQGINSKRICKQEGNLTEITAWDYNDMQPALYCWSWAFLGCKERKDSFKIKTEFSNRYLRSYPKFNNLLEAVRALWWQLDTCMRLESIKKHNKINVK